MINRPRYWVKTPTVLIGPLGWLQAIQRLRVAKMFNHNVELIPVD